LTGAAALSEAKHHHMPAHVMNTGDSLSCTSSNHAPFFEILKFPPLPRAVGVMVGNPHQPWPTPDAGVLQRIFKGFSGGLWTTSSRMWLSRWGSWATADRWAGGGRPVVHGLSSGSRAAA